MKKSTFTSSLLLATLFLAPQFIHAQTAKPIGSYEPANVNLLYTDLLQLQRQEVRLKNEAQVRKMNQDGIVLLEATRPTIDNKSHRKEFLTLEEMQLIQDSIDDNPVASDDSEYSRPDVSIGYCFGRATFYHITLLKNKIDKSAIRKAFVVGPMDAYGIMWQFHVATVVRGPDMKWYAIDPNQSKPTELSLWTEKYFQMSPQKNVRLYITDAKKFTISAKYDRLQMGLSLDRNADWYRGYFTDLMESFKDQKPVLK